MRYFDLAEEDGEARGCAPGIGYVTLARDGQRLGAKYLRLCVGDHAGHLTLGELSNILRPWGLEVAEIAPRYEVALYAEHEPWKAPTISGPFSGLDEARAAAKNAAESAPGAGNWWGSWETEPTRYMVGEFSWGYVAVVREVAEGKDGD